MPREDLIEKLRREEFDGRNPKWQVSERRGKKMPYAETPRAYFFRIIDTGTIIVQPKNPSNALPYCYSCEGEILTVVGNAHITEDNEEQSGSPFRQEWIRQSFPVAMPYCPGCDQKPNGGQRFCSIEAFYDNYGRKFEEILPTMDTPKRA